MATEADADDRVSPPLTAVSLGVLLGASSGIGIVIGSRWPGAIEHYDPFAAALVIVRLMLVGLVLSLIIGLALWSIGRVRSRHVLGQAAVAGGTAESV